MRRTALALFSLLFLSASQADPLATEIAKWAAFLESDQATGATWADIKPGIGPLLTRTQDALKQGKRLLALNRYAVARANLEGAAYAAAKSDAERKEQAQFEAEWQRMGKVLKANLQTPAADAFQDIDVAAVRALAEIASMQIRGFYEASLEYSRNTMPETGLFYVGSAKAQRDFIAFARSLPDTSTGALPPLRSLAGEIETLQGELLTAYKPPLSIEKHSEFIGASSMLNEARQLDAAGLRFGALMRYLDAARRTAQIQGSKLSADGAAKQLEAFDARVKSASIDHSIGQLFVETAQADPALAPVIVESVLPRYFAALDKAATRPSPPPAKVTVTLIRWPYT